MSREIILTKEGLKEKQKELKHLLEVVRPEVIQELVEARNQGDLSENADYDAARNRQAEVEARIKEVETMIAKAKIIEEGETKSNKGVIHIGSKVTYTIRGHHHSNWIKIVGVIEADPFKNLVSNESPLARAILGHRSGDVVEVREVRHPYQLHILAVE